MATVAARVAQTRHQASWSRRSRQAFLLRYYPSSVRNFCAAHMRSVAGRESKPPFLGFMVFRSPQPDTIRSSYQEGCLSPRCLPFLNGLSYFVCRTSVWREYLMAESSDLLPFEAAKILGRTASKWPLERYAGPVQSYSARDLTYPLDILNAFPDIEKALVETMDGIEMVYGMPFAVFDWALLWSASPGASLKRCRGMSSWSWAGWQGAIKIPITHSSEVDQRWLRERTWIEWDSVSKAKGGESGESRSNSHSLGPRSFNSDG